MKKAPVRYSRTDIGGFYRVERDPKDDGRYIVFASVLEAGWVPVCKVVCYKGSDAVRMYDKMVKNIREGSAPGKGIEGVIDLTDYEGDIEL